MARLSDGTIVKRAMKERSKRSRIRRFYFDDSRASRNDADDPLG